MRFIAESSNGRTTDFGSVYSGSNPGSAALRQAQCRLYMNASITWFVYMLLCDQKTFYVGQTNDIANRFFQHKNKLSFYTKQFSDIKFVYSERYKTEKDAIRREKQIKGWSHAKKQFLIDGKLGINTCTGLVEELLVNGRTL
jgi:putative endonuclease